MKIDIYFKYKKKHVKENHSNGRSKVEDGCSRGCTHPYPHCELLKNNE